jgi:nicotinate phosphoribosyltransferase
MMGNDQEALMSQPESTALFTDHYELTMLETALASGVANYPAIFEVFTRSLPNGRRYGVFAGVPRALEAIRNFRFDADDINWLLCKGIVSDSTAKWLSNYHFSGTVRGYAEGEVYFPGSPVFTVEAPFAEALLLETVLLSILTDDSAIATTAARIAHAAQGRRLIDMGSRRTNEYKAVTAARAAYIGGFDATSNLRAERIYGVPGAGTAAHALTQAHASEAEAFAAQVATFGAATTLLVDTYDTHAGVDAAVAAAGPSLGGIRIDSGDLLAEATWARNRLNELGAHETKILVSGNLNEYEIDRLVRLDELHAIDGFGVGENLVSGGLCPQTGFVYKLVAIADGGGDTPSFRPVAKRSVGKATVGGRKYAYRAYSSLASLTRAAAELILTDDSDKNVFLEYAWATPLQVEYPIRGSETTTLESARQNCARAIDSLPGQALDLSPGEPVIPTRRVGSES